MYLNKCFTHTAPAAPGYVIVNEVDVLTADISWSPPDDIPGYRSPTEDSNLFDAYEIYVTEDATEEREHVATVPRDGELTLIVTGLKPTTNYTFEVGTVLYAADQFPTQRSDGNPTAQNQNRYIYV